jgi:hypothetical protein
VTGPDNLCSSETSERIVARLVIALPSVHEGGEVVIFHEGERIMKASNKFSEFRMSFFAW